VDNGTPNKSKDLDALRAKLGLKDGPKPKLPGEAPAPAAPQAPTVNPDGFDLNFGGAQGKAAGGKDRPIDLSVDEHSVQPKGRGLVTAVVVVVVALMAAFLGLQFGKNMGLRTLYNSGLDQAKSLEGYFFGAQVDASGNPLGSKTDGLAKFNEAIGAYYTGSAQNLRQLAAVLATGDPAELAKLGDLAKHEKQLELLKELSRILDKFIGQVEYYEPQDLFSERAFNPEMVYEVSRYTHAANKLYSAAIDMGDAILLLEGLTWSPAPPEKVPGELLVWAPRKEYQEGVRGSLVAIQGKPEEKKEVVEDVTCEAVKLPVQVPKCQVKEGEEPFEIHELDVFEKKVAQRVVTLHEMKVKKLGDDETSATASGADIVQVDARGFLLPLATSVQLQFRAEMVNKAIILNEILENLDRLQEMASAANPEALKSYLKKLNAESRFFTL
jgi:hypothetical protein